MKISERRKKAIPHDHLAVYEVIANHSEKYVTRNMILAQLSRNGDYSRKLSEIIYDLIVRYSLPVGSSSAKETKGYFIIENDNDKRVAQREMGSRLGTMQIRYEAIKNIKF